MRIDVRSTTQPSCSRLCPNFCTTKDKLKGGKTLSSGKLAWRQICFLFRMPVSSRWDRIPLHPLDLVIDLIQPYIGIYLSLVNTVLTMLSGGRHPQPGLARCSVVRRDAAADVGLSLLEPSVRVKQMMGTKNGRRFK